jgi:putative pyruvate formate lyase activating enzyme
MANLDVRLPIQLKIKRKIEKIDYFLEKYKSVKECCDICPHRCRVNRSKSAGKCGEPWVTRISSYNIHHGEEPPVSGICGSGTIFFTGCNMKCSYCQNFPISQLRQAHRDTTTDELAGIMLNLQGRKAHNINFVTPNHYLYQIVEALKTAYSLGLNIPLVYNSSGFDRADVIADLDGIIDIYLPDAKYYSPDISEKYSCTRNYFEENSRTLLEMYSQTGDELETDCDGIALKGLIIRHLVLPGNIENTLQILEWICGNLSNRVHISLMGQYFPAHKISSDNLPELNRRINGEEYDRILEFAEKLGFENAWFQEI